MVEVKICGSMNAMFILYFIHFPNRHKKEEEGIYTFSLPVGIVLGI